MSDCKEAIPDEEERRRHAERILLEWAARDGDIVIPPAPPKLDIGVPVTISKFILSLP